jgi:hypothetical protein
MKKFFEWWPRIVAILATALILSCAGVTPVKNSYLAVPRMTIPTEIEGYAENAGYEILGSVVDNVGNILLFLETPEGRCTTVVLLINGHIWEDTCEVGQRMYEEVCNDQNFCTDNPYEIDPNNTVDIPKPGDPDPLPVRGYSDEKIS